MGLDLIELIVDLLVRSREDVHEGEEVSDD
jgi:hypothetical protein